MSNTIVMILAIALPVLGIISFGYSMAWLLTLGHWESTYYSRPALICNLTLLILLAIQITLIS